MKELKVGERVTITLEVVEAVKDASLMEEMAVVQQYHLEWNVFQNIVQTIKV